MIVRAKCPSCGQVEEYTPDEDDLRTAAEKGLASVSFYHGDHVFVIFFDTNGFVRRSTAIKTARPGGEALKPMCFSDLCSLLGKERLALLLAALLPGGRAILASSSPDLAKSIYLAVRRLLGQVKLSAELVENADALASIAEKPGNTVFLTNRASLTGIGQLPGDVLALDLEVPLKLGKEEKKGLKALLKAIDEASKFKDEAAKESFFKNKLAGLRELLDKAAKLLNETGTFSERVLKRELGREVPSEELDFVFFALKRFTGTNAAKRAAQGVREFAL